MWQQIAKKSNREMERNIAKEIWTIAEMILLHFRENFKLEEKG
jgi:hypothetical protein